MQKVLADVGVLSEFKLVRKILTLYLVQNFLYIIIFYFNENSSNYGSEMIRDWPKNYIRKADVYYCLIAQQ